MNDEYLISISNSNLSILSLYEEFCEALINKRFDIAGEFIKRRIDDRVIYHMLWKSIGIRRLDITEFLLSCGANINKHLEFSNRNILIFAIYTENYELLKFLLEHGADITDLPAGYILHQIIISKPVLKFFEYTIRVCQINGIPIDLEYNDKNGRTPMRLAWNRAAAEIAGYLFNMIVQNQIELKMDEMNETSIEVSNEVSIEMNETSIEDSNEMNEPLLFDMSLDFDTFEAEWQT